MVNSTQAFEKRESALKGKVKSITDAKFPVYCNNGEALGHPRRWRQCEFELLEGRRIIGNEFKTKRRAQRTYVTKTEEEKERGRPSPRHQALAW